MKLKVPPSPVNRLILDEASEWFVDFRVGDVDSSGRERFDEWLRRSPEHIRAYMEIAKTYVALPALEIAGKLDVDALIAFVHSGENVVPFGNTSNVRPYGRTPRLRPRFLAAVASAMVLTVAGAAWWKAERYPLYTTDIGERRSITLADGSTVDMNVRSKLRIEFTKAERLVELLAGQALFQVAKDKNRPFIVRSGDATVRAVGTQFDVYRKVSGTTVTVLEGRVAVYATVHTETNPSGSAELPLGSASNGTSRRASAQTQSPGHSPASPRSSGGSSSLPSNPSSLAAPSGSAAIFLSAGEQVTVTPAQVLPAPARADIAATTAWMQRRLIFDGSKLSDVAQEFNRYNRRQLVIESVELSDFHVSGVYSSTDPASLIRFLREQPGVKVTEDDNEVHISSP